jgi:hypothetical protein
MRLLSPTILFTNPVGAFRRQGQESLCLLRVGIALCSVEGCVILS